MRLLLFCTVFLTMLYAEELKIKAKTFNGDQKNGISIFEGNVNMIKGGDELNASKVTVYTDTNQKPTKFVAEGNASYRMVTVDGDVYVGKSQKVVYLPNTKEYYFYTDVHLKQINDKKEIIGDEVILKSLENKAFAKGEESKPVIMIFNVPEDKK